MVNCFDTRRARWVRPALGSLVLAWAALMSGCSALNPAFVDLFGGQPTTENAPGHVILSFVNNAEVDERLINYLTTSAPEGGGVELTPAELRSLRPRMRFRVQVDFVDGSFNIFEFVTGSRKLIDSAYEQFAEPDLNENDLDNIVVSCDVARVAIVEDVEVFIPVAIAQYRLVEPENGIPFYVLEAEAHPDSIQFIPLDVDVVDADGNVLLAQNIGIRDRAVPVVGPACGAVIAFVIDGSLSVPFSAELPTDAPAVRIDDVQSIARIGGRYEVAVQIR